MDASRGQRIGYTRVSTADQNLDRQINALGDIDRLFTDEASGSTRERPGLDTALDYLRDGDELVVTSMDRLARSVRDLHELVDELTGRGVTVAFLREAQTYRPGAADPMGRLMLSMLGAVAEFERAIIHERQAEGIAAARRRGVYARRRPTITQQTADEVHRLVDQGVPKTAVARRLGLSRAAVYRILDGTYAPENRE